MTDLAPDLVLALGKTADWVAITADAVWAGSTGPFAVTRVDPRTRERRSVVLPGEPCAGLAADGRHLWVPLCGVARSLARIDLATYRLDLFEVGAVQEEGGIAIGAGSVWLPVDAQGTLGRVDARSGRIRARLHLEPGSINPRFSRGTVWVTSSTGAQVTRIAAASNRVLGTVSTGPRPHFLTADADFVWTLNQGDGSLTRIDARTLATATIELHTPGHGGDIAAGGGLVWTTMAKTPLSGIDPRRPALECQWSGAGGDSLGIGFGALWLTDYHAGTLSRFDLHELIARCHGGQPRRR